MHWGRSLMDSVHSGVESSRFTEQVHVYRGLEVFVLCKQNKKTSPVQTFHLHNLSTSSLVKIVQWLCTRICQLNSSLRKVWCPCLAVELSHAATWFKQCVFCSVTISIKMVIDGIELWKARENTNSLLEIVSTTCNGTSARCLFQG